MREEREGERIEEGGERRGERREGGLLLILSI